MSNVVGIVEVVSRDGNLKLDGKWVNASTSELAAQTAPRWRELKTKQCVVEIDERGRFTSVNLYAAPSGVVPKTQAGDYRIPLVRERLAAAKNALAEAERALDE